MNRGGQWGGSVESMKGKGPKGYRRSDERIEEQLNDTFTDDHMLDASNIEVTVKNGEVTLSGTVNNREAKRRAEDLAENLSGVTNVENRIRVSEKSEEQKGTQDRGAQESDKSKSQNKNKTHQNAEA
jgi:Flp pilus assembly secretin CpaC